MKIAINLLYLIPDHVGGTQTYAISLIQALAKVDTENEYILFVNRESANLEIVDAPNFRRVICPVLARRREMRYAYEQLILPKLLDRHQINLVHSLGYVCPLNVSCANIVTIHDLNYHALRDSMTPGKRLLLGWFVRQSARRADHILTVSEFSRGQIIQFLGIDPASVTVTHLGPRALSEGKNEDWQEVSARYRIAGPYVMAFSGLSPHKNIQRLLQAYAKVCTGLPHTLVLVGHLPEGGAVRAEMSRLGISNRVIVTGYVPDSHVMLLIKHADVFVFPSLYEGFGLPVLDAQQAGVVVACSAAACLPEVAGKAAVLFDPLSIEEMTAAIRTCILDQPLRSRLMELGFQNVQQFSWEQTALQTRSIYQKFGMQRTERNKEKA